MIAVARARAGVAMGLDKSGTQAIGQSVWTKVTGFVARAGYPDTNLVNDSCHMTGGPVTGTVTFRGQLAAALNTRQFQAGINGTLIDTPVNEDTTATVPNVTLGPDDELELWVFCSQLIGRTVNAGSTTTYIYFEPA